MNHDVVNAYVKSDYFNLYTTMYELSFFHHILCEDNNGNQYLFKSSVGEHFHIQIQKEQLEYKYCKKIENYIKRNYSSKHLSLIVYAILSDLPDETIAFLSRKQNEDYADYLLNAFLQGISCEKVENLKKSVCSKDLITVLISFTPPFTYFLENMKTHEIKIIKKKNIIDDTGSSFTVEIGNKTITLNY